MAVFSHFGYTPLWDRLYCAMEVVAERCSGGLQKYNGTTVNKGALC